MQNNFFEILHFLTRYTLIRDNKGTEDIKTIQLKSKLKTKWVN